MIYFTAHTFNCVCHYIRAMFRVLGIYNFVLSLKFKFQAQDSFLEYFFWDLEIWKNFITLSEKKPPLPCKKNKKKIEKKILRFRNRENMWWVWPWKMLMRMGMIFSLNNSAGKMASSFSVKSLCVKSSAKVQSLKFRMNDRFVLHKIYL